MAAKSPALRRRPSYPLLRFGCLGVLLMFFGGCLLLNAAFAGDLFIQGPWVFTMAAFFATATAVPYGILLLWFDRNEQEPLLLVGTAFMWGAVVATAISLVFNTSFGLVAMDIVGNPAVADQLTASISAPFIEELTKGIAVFIIFLLFRRDFDNVLDGILYGALIGLGFAWLENIIYYVRAGSGGVENMFQLVWIRGVLNGATSHAAYTGLTGLGFGLVRVLRKGVLRWAFVPLFWGMAMFAHFLWNTFVGPLIYLTGANNDVEVLLVSLPLAVVVLQSPFVLLLLLITAFIWGHENRIIRTQLGHEPPDVATPTEIAQLVPARKRIFTGFLRFFRGGPMRWWHHRRMSEDQIRLAFNRWHLTEDSDVDWTPDEDADIVQLRERIRKRRVRMAR